MQKKKKKATSALVRAGYALVLLGSSIFTGGGSCSWSGRGPTCTEEVFWDTWEVECGCMTVGSGLPVELTTGGTKQACNEPSTVFGPLEEQGACNVMATELLFRNPDLHWTCGPISSRHVSSGDCPESEIVSCDDVGSSRGPLIGWQNYGSTFIGTLDPSLSHVSMTIDGTLVTPTLSGEVFVTGGDCDGATCPMTVDGLFVRLGDFDVNGHTVRDVDLITIDAWPGTKYADDTYAFDPDAPLKLSATIDGDRGYDNGSPEETLGGAFHSEPEPFRYMTIEGTFEFGTGVADVYLIFPFGGGVPRPEIDARYISCTVFNPGRCGYVFDASGSRDFSGNPVARYRWTDAQGRLLGTDAIIYADNIYEITGEPSRFPLVVTVTDNDGNENSRATGPWPEPQRSGASAFAWAYAPTASSYTTSSSYSWSSSGQPISITRSAVGSYTVSFAGLGGAGGNVQVSAYGDDRACKVGGWWSSGGALLTSIRCYDGSGAAANARFDVQFHREALVDPAPRDHTPELAYLWAHSPTTAEYTPSASYAFNDGGAASTIRRLSTGVYEVTVPGHSSTGASAQVSAYGGTNQRCQLRRWRSAGGAALLEVACFTPSGVSADSMFTLSLTQQTVPSAAGAARRKGAYARVMIRDGQATVPVNWQYNALSSAAVYATTSSTGSYVVNVPRTSSVANDHVQVTATGTTAARCRVRSWGRYSDRTAISVGCTNMSGAPIDSAFELRYLTSSP